MKTKILPGWRWILAVSCTMTLLGCLDRTSETGAQTIIEPSAAAAVEKPASDEQVDKTPVRVVIPPANLSPGLAEVVKLAHSGVSEEVLLAYVEKANHTFNPTVDEIVYLKDIGISDSVVAMMVRHENMATSEIAQTPSGSATVETQTVSELTQSNLTGPSLIDPNAPSYSVTSEQNYNEIATAAPPQQVTINYFESALSPYGNWIEVPDYGRCWQPTVVVINRNWRPYSDRGRWLHTSNGWYWQSDYSWGWAPFHYGRWHNDIRIGWVWVPGSTWGPAWVSWRYTDQYCGWAPLPPSAHYVSGFGFSYYNSRVGINFGFGLPYSCYTFIPTSRFCERSPGRYYVSGSHSKTIYNNSVVINNYTRGNNNTIINEGIGRERITAATKTPIRTVSLRELPTTSNPVGRAERLEGNTLTVFKPNVSAATVTRSVTQRSLTTTAPVSQNSPTTSRNLRSITKTETTTVPSTPSTATVAPIDPAPNTQRVAPIDPVPTSKTVTRTISPSTVGRSSSSQTAVPKTVTTSPGNSSQRSIVTTQPGSSNARNLPVQSQPQQIGRTIERRESSVAPTANPRTVERNISSPVPQTPVVREAPTAPVARSIPSAQIQQSQPTGRETRRQEVSQFNSGAQRSFPTPTPAAPVQNFSQSREINRGSSQFERPAAQVVQPRLSAPTPAPSVRQSAPRQEAPAPRQQIQRSVEQSRSERRN